MTTTNPYIHTYYVNLRNGADIRREKQPLASGDKNADVFLVHLQDGGKVVSLDGTAVTGKVIRADGQTVPLAGSVADGAAKITLDENCYAVPGEIKLTVTVSAGDVVQSVLIVTMDVQTSETSIVVDNGVIGTLSELLAEIENMRAATQEATDATAAANAAIDAANTALDKTAADAQAAIAQAVRDTDAAVTEIREVATQAAPPIVVEADGALVAIGDGGARPVVRLVSSMAAVQSGSGEPSPENVRAITGWDSVAVHRTGQNLVSLTDYEVTSGHNASVITADVIDVVTPSSFDYGRIPVLLKGGVTYTLVIDWEVYGREADSTKATRSAYRMRDVDDSYYQNSVYDNAARRFVRVYKPEADVETVVLWHPNYGGDLPSSSRSQVMLLVGEYTADTAPTFVPGECAALTAALPETVFGGHLDWASGLLTVTHGLIALDGTETWASNGGTQYYTLDELPRAGVSAVYPMCTHYPGGNAYTGSVANGVLVSPTKIWLRDARFDSDTAGLKAWFAAQAAAGTPVQIVYQLAEPYTVQIDPQVMSTLRGSNVIWSDCGNTAVAYIADTKIYIDNAVAAIAASIINA